MTLHCGDSFAYLQTLPDNSVDAVVTDPPYGLGTPPDPATVLAAWLDTGHHEVKGGGFMGKAWDSFVPQPAFWKEVYRVLKPGGHVAAFFGTRTYDWGAMAIRLAGFEVRTQLTWVFGSGFPKGTDIGRAIDLSRGGVGEWNTTPDELEWCDDRDEHIGQKRVNLKIRGDHPIIYTPQDPEAAQWQGWSTQLKPAHEPICLARKPCSEGTVAANVLRWRTGALNIGACRVPGADSNWVRTCNGTNVDQFFKGKLALPLNCGTTEGRYPATLLHDGSDAVLGEFPTSKSSDAGGPIYCRNESPTLRGGSGKNVPGKYQCERHGFTDEGSAARYFTAAPYELGELESLVPFLYCAKASTAERNAGLTNEAVPTAAMTGNLVDGQRKGGDGSAIRTPIRRNLHPTVKPIRLMEWLCNLLCPPGGIILDPFMGSGTTGIAAGRNGFDFIGCDLDPSYVQLATERIAHWTHYQPELPKVSNPKPLETPNTPTLF
jgi:DNA modification methylase